MVMIVVVMMMIMVLMVPNVSGNWKKGFCKLIQGREKVWNLKKSQVGPGKNLEI